MAKEPEYLLVVLGVAFAEGKMANLEQAANLIRRDDDQAAGARREGAGISRVLAIRRVLDFRNMKEVKRV